VSKRYAKAHPCPTATKDPYPDEIAAKLALDRIRSGDDPRRDKLPTRVYPCTCGAWHLTSSRVPYADRPTVGRREWHSGS